MISRFAMTVFITWMVLLPIVSRGQNISATSGLAIIEQIVQKSPDTIRVASFNVSLYGKKAGEVAERLLAGDDSQATDLATVIQSVRPDILLLCEIDHDADGRTLDAFAEGYAAIDYPYRWSIPTNTGLLGKLDLDSDGDVELPTDAHGFGQYPGQYAMAILSRFEIDRDAIRTFQTFRWSTMPAALKPVDPVTGRSYYSDTVWQSLRLSSKNHADVPILIPTSQSEGSAGNGDSNPQALHLLASHPTPPVFDGKEDRNGKRNHDEIRFWNEYISKPDAEWIIDDSGTVGGLQSDSAADAMFVIAGDLNSDPKQGDSLRSGIANLISNPRVQDAMPTSSQHGISTAKFGRNEIRVDYVLPSSNLHVLRSAVVWPDAQTDLGKRVRATDHRMVWIDIERPSPQ